MSTHSVENHLKLKIDEYDTVILKLVPHYEEMVSYGIGLVKKLVKPSPHLIDLGSGTGRFAEFILKNIPNSTVTLVDIDAEMLGEAKRRLQKFEGRTQFLNTKFTEPLPKADAIVASLSLHHIKEAADKRQVYHSIFQALDKNAFFLCLDVTVSTDPIFNGLTIGNWTNHLMANGMTSEQVKKSFADWGREEHYFSLAEELKFMEKAGFENPECFWRHDPMTIFGGRKVPTG